MRKLLQNAQILLVALLFASTLFANAANERPNGRVLFVVETTSAMSASKSAVNSSIQSILDSGLNGQLHFGDTIGVWTYNDKLNTDCPMILWRGEHVQDIKGAVNEWISRQKFTKKSQFAKVLPPLQSVIRSSQKLIIIWISHGDDAIAGTPFDNSINELHKTFRAGFQKQHIPFVTALVVRNGAVVDFTVNPGDARLRLPEFLDREAKELEAAKKAQAEAAQAQAEAEARKAKKPPLIIRVGPSPELLQQKTNVVKEEPKATNPPVAATNAPATNAAPVAPQTAVTNSNSPVAPVAVATNAVVQSNKPATNVVVQTNAVQASNAPIIAPQPAVIPTPQPPAAAKTNTAPAAVAKVAPAPVSTNRAPASENSEPIPVVAASSNLTNVYLGIVVVVLVLILAVVVIAVIKSNNHKSPSIISQSMARDRFKTDASKQSSDNPADRE